eukprot:TRINITY_DN46769_c0_g1_i1.p1 TRINITY_DN46769_c0_g1~~TRINITY_DN46769_c0_g1_i1.p1  ORF type:complete len:279 (+),score=53.51 TRINITY_DN46769_c0_g1_i1:55-837(+)
MDGVKAFNKEDVEYLSAFSAFIGITLKNVNLFERDKRTHETLRLLLRVSVMTATAPDYASTVLLFEKEIPDVIGCEACCIFVKSPDNILRVCKEDREFKEVSPNPKGIAFQVSQNAIRQYTTKPLDVFSKEASYDPTCDNVAGVPNPQTALIMQLRLDERIVGVLQVTNKRVKPYEARYTDTASTASDPIGPFTPADEALLQEVAVVASVTLAERYRRESVSTDGKGSLRLPSSMLLPMKNESYTSLEYLRTPKAPQTPS